MENKRMEKNNEFEVGIQRLLSAVWAKGWLIALVSVVVAVLVFLGTFFLVTPLYQSSAMFYVNNNDLSLGGASISISSGDLTTSRNLVDSYIVILNTKETLEGVIRQAGVDYTYEEIKEKISAKAVNETEIFQVTVTCDDPYEAERIANAVVSVLPKQIGKIIDGSSAKVVESASFSLTPSSPSLIKNTALGFLLGLILSISGVVLYEVFDITIRLTGDIDQCCSHPVLVTVPDMTAAGKGSSAYYGSSRGKYGVKSGKYAAANHSAKTVIIGPDISFSASEAYKLLRTKLEFSFTDDNDCRVIGLSSALSGEGKSLTAVNLAFALAQLNKKVLLVDCDMRRPTLAEKLKILKQPGLSSYLTRQCNLDDLVQTCGIKGSENAFHVISAGQNPPNPVELLSSERMKKALSAMRKVYDYVILDFPPVGEVSDALAIAKETDGMLLVVRQNCCDRVRFVDTVRQFEFINAKVLGVVFNCATEQGGSYSKRYYKRYYKRYDSLYQNGVNTTSGRKQ